MDAKRNTLAAEHAEMPITTKADCWWSDCMARLKPEDLYHLAQDWLSATYEPQYLICLRSTSESRHRFWDMFLGKRDHRKGRFQLALEHLSQNPTQEDWIMVERDLCAAMIQFGVGTYGGKANPIPENTTPKRDQ